MNDLLFHNLAQLSSKLITHLPTESKQTQHWTSLDSIDGSSSFSFPKEKRLRMYPNKLSYLSLVQWGLPSFVTQLFGAAPRINYENWHLVQP